ncbi:hypothetical protein GA0074696_5699 [Micromonospora purpureochromogenes]|uniref:DUF4185 domain-containing protein n=1 Tax=Micromonospora purpureochromogenes TaxID=47872 RepID=A0A1C5ABP9_9ACTN|nr:hypothetical protein [Micromonospora purpureochromogenes]SCF42640.1 hypothetical protein GA0074696_5699 [Micromonospora purpureochromogenes]
MTLRLVEFVVAGNEASDLLPVRSPALLRAHGARRGFWTVLDEGPVERCLALLLERSDGEWVARHVPADAGVENGRTEDGEALAHHDGWVYVFGSHFGSKAGPLRPRRAFVARFREDDAAAGTLPVRVVRNRFRVHRVVNDALAKAPFTPLPPGDRVRRRFIVETLARGTARAKSWVSRLAEDDLPLNVEAAAFTPDGTVLLGLRFPVTAAGEPILVELAGVPEMFAGDGDWPVAGRAYALTGVTPPGALVGFRAIAPTPDGGYAAVVGSIDALGKGSVLLDDHPAGGGVTSRHVRFRWRPGAEEHLVAGELVADLAPFHHVEGLAELDGSCFYVTDEDHRVALWIG